jgi:ArsR family transcriptional regulator
MRRSPLPIDDRRYVDIHIDGCQSVRVRQIEVRQIESECCPALLEDPLGQADARQLASWLKVLADPARLRLVSLIAASPEHEACVCNLTAPLGLSQPTVSHHLKVLNDAGIVEREQRGRWAFFRLRYEPLAILAGALTGSALAVS